jgi:hypothetical protein
MIANDRTVNRDLFTSNERNIDDVLFFTEQKSLNLNTVAGLYVLYSVFSLFVLSFVSVLLFFGIETELLPDIVAIMLSAAVVVTALALLYATAKIIE